MQTITYKDAGVDIQKADRFVDSIKRFAGSTFDEKVVTNLGGFCALYDMGDRYLAAATDGVGTKIRFAIEMGLHDTIGQDLVAMCVNDLICAGARPLFFLDYLATGRLDLKSHKDVVEGIARACKEAGVALIGGETAEMPGMYQFDDYDLAGFCVGEVQKNKVITGNRIKPGDVIIGLESSGPHSNGYSLIRKVVAKHERDLMRELLTPTRLYVQPILRFIDTNPGLIKGMAHITGGGFQNIARMNKERKFKITNYPEPPQIFKLLQHRTGLSHEELYSTFNMGIGFTVVISPQVKSYFINLMNKQDVKAQKIGVVE